MLAATHIHKLLAWVVFCCSLAVYVYTIEPSVSFWDCGEFIAASFGLQITHPPGAPLYQLLARMFSLLSLGNTQQVAFFINLLSAVSSSFCVLLTYLITCQLAQKICSPLGIPLAKQQHYFVWGAGVVAALTLAFTDTFWYSAVEAEVYALSSLFTLLVFWSALKWHQNKSSYNHLRWLLFAAFCIGLSIGVHLLNLLVIPAVTVVVYIGYKGYTLLGTLKAIAMGVVLLLTAQYIIIPGIPYLAALTDRWGVNSMGWSVGMGAWLLIGGLFVPITAVLFSSHALKRHTLHTVTLCIAFVLIGYSSYIWIPIRAAAQPPLNANKPDNAASFISYLNRDQYGQRPFLKGPYFNAKIDSTASTTPIWRINEANKYEVTDRNTRYYFNDSSLIWFPRMGDVFDRSSHIGYTGWTGAKATEPASQLKNGEFFLKYQFFYMYVRYHLWNFAGRQNDLQGYGSGLEGSVATGITVLDNLWAANPKGQPMHIEKNKGSNHYYLLPLLLGAIGFFYHARKSKESFWPLLVLFLFTGVFLCIYLNPPPFEPRERDYVYAGSFQVFCVWVGIGTLAFMRQLHRRVAQGHWVAFIICFCAAPALLLAQNFDDHNRANRPFAKQYAQNFLQQMPPNAILFVSADNDTYPLWYIQQVENFRPDVQVININLLDADWAAFGLAQPHHKSPPLQLSILPHQYQKGIRKLIRIENGDSAISLQKALAFLANTQGNTQLYGGKKERCYLPTGKLFFKLDTLRTGTSLKQFDIPIEATYLNRSTLIFLDIVANNFYTRPIFFASRTNNAPIPSLNNYLRLEGLAYRLVPQVQPKEIKNKINTAQMDSVLRNYAINGFNNAQTYIGKEAYWVAAHYFTLFSLTIEKMLDEGKTQQAGQLAKIAAQTLPIGSIPIKQQHYAHTILKALWASGNEKEAEEYYSAYTQRLMQECTYYHSLQNTHARVEARREWNESSEGLKTMLKNTMPYLPPNKAKQIENFLSFFAQQTQQP